MGCKILILYLRLLWANLWCVAFHNFRWIAVLKIGLCGQAIAPENFTNGYKGANCPSDIWGRCMDPLTTWMYYLFQGDSLRCPPTPCRNSELELYWYKVSLPACCNGIDSNKKDTEDCVKRNFVQTYIGAKGIWQRGWIWWLSCVSRSLEEPFTSRKAQHYTPNSKYVPDVNSSLHIWCWWNDRVLSLAHNNTVHSSTNPKLDQLQRVFKHRNNVRGGLLLSLITEVLGEKITFPESWNTFLCLKS